MNDLLDDIAEYNLSDTKLTPYANLNIWCKRWKEELYRQKCSQGTIKGYMFGVKTFLNFSKKNRKIDIDRIGARYINRYLIDYQLQLAQTGVLEKKLTEKEYLLLSKEAKKKTIGKNDANFMVHEVFENTLSQRLTIVKMFLKFITENNKEQHDYTRLFDKLAKIKIQDKFTDYLTEDELGEVVEYMHIWTSIYKDHKPKSSERYAYRDALLMIIYALTGARSDEVTHIRLSDITLYTKNSIDRYIIKIDKAKGGKKRTVGIKRDHIEKFMQYFKAVLPGEEYFLSSTYKDGYTNKPMSSNAIRGFSNTILKNLGIHKTGLHAFRRGYVTKRIGSDDVDISIVAKEVGNTIAILEKHYLKHSAEAFMQ